MKFNIGTKVNLLIVIALILVGGASLILSISSLNSQGEFAVEKYRTGMMDEKRAQIKDLVNSAWTIAKEKLEASKDKEAIRKEYGGQAKAVIDQAMGVLEGIDADAGYPDIERKKEAAIQVMDKMRWGELHLDSEP